MKNIRCKAVCVFSYQQSILVAKDADPQNGSTFYVPLGGGIEFGETSQSAVIREIREEIGAEISDIQFLGVLENLFLYGGLQCHEVIFVYDAKFVEMSFYEKASIIGQETNGLEIIAAWKKLDDFPAQGRLVPDGLFDLLTMRPNRNNK